MGQYCFAGWCPSSSVVVCNAAGGPAGRARGQAGGRHCTAGQYGYVPLGRHLVYYALSLAVYQGPDSQRILGKILSLS